ncbi:dihydroxyacetone kinase subunit DhaL [Photobacterium sp. DNB23_23_1]|uniref:Dihydroxyacetone kinase subunit DhaL n=1 Tax=Photobacterium pectinilyticum TaxID=2906793 RepID=A0ABT1N2T9_9GAMM|nr:dihydroxyacetone kinase subunit DhaL [Photobacterium sp. ZSDE20]MCQ1059055.1 dihydroxyacetone kinase subunit DhaL [Photobacterium sp. ZSDE20]MDD1824202.1 dihydroxyacetone kinase subunit L [Photobacterium sp. ZSDE20]
MNVTQLVEMMKFVASEMVKSEPMLTKFDQAIGDGDHGIGMERGFVAVEELLASSPEYADVSEAFKAIGTTMMASMGGASGAIFGTLFRSGAKAIKGEKTLTTPVLLAFLDAGLEAIYKRGGANPGDKTMIDALVPAIESLRQTQPADFEQDLQNAADASYRGMLSTKDMIATTGKAKTLGERSLGHPDPGAMSMSLILKFMADHCNEAVAV